MKKHSKFISMLLAMLMVVSSLSIAFAVDELEAQPQADDQTTVTKETAPDTEKDSSDVEGTAPGEKDAEASENATETGEPVEEITSESMEASKRSRIEELIYGLEKPIVTVKINYVYKKDGEEAAPSVTQEIELKENSKGVFEGKYSVKSPTLLGYAPDKEVVEGTVNADSKNPITITVSYSPAPAQPVTNLKAHPSYKAIVLTWDGKADADRYIVQRSTDKQSYTTIKTIENNGAKEISYIDTNANGTTGTFDVARTYYYKVTSVSLTGIKATKATETSGSRVRPMYEKVSFKEGIKLTSHDGKNVEVPFHSGQTITTQGFGGGKYEFWYNGNFFTVNYARVKNCTADYQVNKISKSKSYSGVWARQNYASASGVTDNYQGLLFYDKISAESFVNRLGRASKTKYLIWVSTYTQHVYLFQGSKGNWKLINDWECATGAAQSPTPTGFDKQLERYVRYRHGVNWWRPFQTWNSIHGKLSSWEMGGPASNGCVRNFDQNAKLVYDKCPNGTALVVY
jgi:hypothetical protein